MPRLRWSVLPALIAAFFALSCQERKPEVPATPAQTAAAKAEADRKPTPKDRGDIYIYGSIGDASNLLPYLAGDSTSLDISGQVFSSLMTVDKNLDLIPDLAEKWDVSEDQKTITFRLRQGVKWHDGHPWSSADLVFQYEMMVHPDVPSAYKETFIQIEKAAAPDDHTFMVTFREPYSPGLVDLMGMGGLPKHLLKDTKPADLIKSPLARKPVGNGPWKFVSWETQQALTLEANPEHHDWPFLSRTVMRIIPDPAVEFLELQAGKIDSMDLKPMQYLRQTDGRQFKDKFVKYRYMSRGYTYLGYNLKKPIWMDKRVRQAMTYAINKQEIIDAAVMGMGVPATGPIKYGTWAYKEDVKKYPYDPELAKKLLAEAGWKDSDGDGILDKDGKPFDFEIVTNQGNDVRKNAAQIIQQDLKKIGVTARIRVIEWSSFINNFINKRAFDAVILGWGLGIDPNPYEIWHSSKTGEHEFNFISYSNPEVDELLEKGRRVFDREKRKEYYHRFQDILAEDQPYTFLYVPDSLPIISKRVRGIDPGPAGIAYNFNDWWVPAGEWLRGPVIVP